jgi:hypothetical protein
MIQIHPRPRVLLLGSTCGDPSLDAALRDIADVYTLPGAEYDDEALLIQQAVKSHGPFDVFGVSFHSPRDMVLMEGIIRTWR